VTAAQSDTLPEVSFPAHRRLKQQQAGHRRRAAEVAAVYASSNPQSRSTALKPFHVRSDKLPSGAYRGAVAAEARGGQRHATMQKQFEDLKSKMGVVMTKS